MSDHGIDLAVVVAVTAAVVVWSLVAERLERWNVTAPMVFVTVGAALSTGPLHVLDVGIGDEAIRTLAELTLAVVLFGDAADVDVRRLRSDLGLPARLLLIGLPLTMAAGTLAAHLLFPHWSWWVCALVGAAVAPTDAALGAAIIDDDRVPMRIRRVLNVESGLNDGIATPFVNFFVVAAVVGTSFEQVSESGALRALAFGALLGTALGAAGGVLLELARARGVGGGSYRSIGVAALAVLSWALAVHLDANGFVAAFVAGLAYGATARTERSASLSFTHHTGRVMSMFVWFAFGAVMVPLLAHATWRDAAFAVLALTIVRMGPVAVSLIGMRFDRATVGVIGWFGPRGLASVVFALIAAGSVPDDEGRPVVVAITAVVVLSVLAHGISAAPIAGRFARTHHDDEPAAAVP